MAQENKNELYGKKFQSFAWALAWLAFVALLISNIVNAVKTMEVPKKEDYYK